MPKKLTKKLKEDYRFARKVALEYCETADFVSQRKVAEMFNITPYAVSVFIKIAIERFLITYKDAKKIQAKERRNTLPHYSSPEDAGKTVTDRYFDEIFEAREKYLRETYASPDRCVETVQYYVDHPNIKNAYDYLGLSQKEMNFVIKRAIVYGYINDETYLTLKKTGLGKIPKNDIAARNRAIRDFAVYDRERNNYAVFVAEIEELENRLALMQSTRDADAKEIENLKVSLEKAKASLVVITDKY